MPNEIKRAANQQHVLNNMLNHEIDIDLNLRALSAASLTDEATLEAQFFPGSIQMKSWPLC